MKKGVKKMPNHEKIIITAKVLKQDEGENRAFRREKQAKDRKALGKR